MSMQFMLMVSVVACDSLIEAKSLGMFIIVISSYVWTAQKLCDAINSGFDSCLCLPIKVTMTFS